MKLEYHGLSRCFHLFDLRSLLAIVSISPRSLVLFGMFLAYPAHALLINVTDPDPHLSVTQSPCPPHSACGVTAYLWADPINLANAPFFQAAFYAWNDDQPDYEKWQLFSGGGLVASVNVDTFDASSYHNPSNHGGGALDIEVSLAYDGTDRPYLVWSQGLYLNYGFGGPKLPYLAMDDNFLSDLPCNPQAQKVPNGTDPTGNYWCGPVYPAQLIDEIFYDRIQTSYDSRFFEADAMLSTVDYANRILTVYEGIHYGFTLWVSEPPTVVLVLLPLALITAVRMRRATSS